jgi:hypothetical protein
LIATGGQIEGECEMFNSNIRRSDDPFDPDKVIVYYPRTREYGLPIYDGETVSENHLSYLQITYCPWCGSKLPGSLRSELLKQLEAHFGHDHFSILECPEEFSTDQWWRARGF